MILKINNLHRQQKSPSNYREHIGLLFYNNKDLDKKEIIDYFIYLKEFLFDINSKTPKEEIIYILENLNYKKISKYSRMINDYVWGYYTGINYKLMKLFKIYGSHELLDKINITDINHRELYYLLYYEKANRKHWFSSSERLNYWKIMEMGLNDYKKYFQDTIEMNKVLLEVFDKRIIKKEAMELLYNKKNPNIFFFSIMYKDHKNLNYDHWVSKLKEIKDDIVTEKEFMIAYPNFCHFSEYIKDENKIDFLMNLFDQEERKNINHYYGFARKYLLKYNIDKNQFKNIKELLEEIDLLVVIKKYGEIDLEEYLPKDFLSLEGQYVVLEDEFLQISLPLKMIDVINLGRKKNNCLSSFPFLERLLVEDIYLITINNRYKDIIISLKKNSKFKIEESSEYLTEEEKKYLEDQINNKLDLL